MQCRTDAGNRWNLEESVGYTAARLKTAPDIAAMQEAFEQALLRMKTVARFRLRHLDAESKEEQRADNLLTRSNSRPAFIEKIAPILYSRSLAISDLSAH